jgi:hypothetical protein
MSRTYGYIYTHDHTKWHQHGGLYFTGSEEDMRRKMDRDKFWPNVFSISDHGNVHLMTPDKSQEPSADEPKASCVECGKDVIPDPAGSPGVWVHAEGEDADADHVAVPEADDEDYDE